ncbi:MAG: RNA polymerase sigma factor [[Eubacterium] saphenum]|nr:RNA polymerase sigma factor [[Eubacterium] saphenum]
MDDEQIIELFFERNEAALSAVSQKYGRYCGIIVKNVIGSASDAEECVNDTLLDVWNSIPPNKPENLRTYVGKIARNNALDRLKRDTAKKRGGEMQAIVDELADFSSDYSVEAVAEQRELLAEINRFLQRLPERKRKVFVLRYWYCCEVSEISALTGFTEANVYNIIKRERKKLLEYLRKRGVLN